MFVYCFLIFHIPCLSVPFFFFLKHLSRSTAWPSLIWKRFYFLSPPHFSEFIASARNRMGNFFDRPEILDYCSLKFYTSVNDDFTRRLLKNLKISNLRDACLLTSHTFHARVVSRIRHAVHNYARVCVCIFLYYMACGRIDTRARVNYFSRNSEPRYRLRNPCATGYASEVNIMHFFYPTHSYFPLILLPFPRSFFFSVLAIFERDKGRICREAKLDKTLHPHPPRHRATPRRAFRML